MTRFYIPDPHIEKELLKIEGNEVRHIRRVLRLSTGDEIVVFDGKGKEYEGTILREDSASVVIRVEKTLASQRDSSLEVTLAQGLLKGEKMDYLIQKATELGINALVPFSSSRSVPRLEQERGERRLRRWERIAIEASKQCGRGAVPAIHPLQEYPEMLQTVGPGGLRLVLWEKGGIRLKEILGGPEQITNVFFIVGAEGGLSQKEIDQAKERGFTPVTLGGRIVRAETASLCLLSILQYEWGDVG